MASKVGSIFVELGLKVEKFNSGLKSATKNLLSFQNIAIAGAATAVTKMAMNFETAMARVNTITDLSKQEFQELEKQTRQLSKTMGVDATDSANALYQAISAGVDPENAVSFLEDATKLAIGSSAELTSVVDTLTSVINAYGMEAEEADRISSILFNTEKMGKTTVAELSTVISRVTPIAAATRNLPNVSLFAFGFSLTLIISL